MGEQWLAGCIEFFLVCADSFFHAVASKNDVHNSITTCCRACYAPHSCIYRGAHVHSASVHA